MIRITVIVELITIRINSERVAAASGGEPCSARSVSARARRSFSASGRDLKRMKVIQEHYILRKRASNHY